MRCFALLSGDLDSVIPRSAEESGPDPSADLGVIRCWAPTARRHSASILGLASRLVLDLSADRRPGSLRQKNEGPRSPEQGPSAFSAASRPLAKLFSQAETHNLTPLSRRTRHCLTDNRLARKSHDNSKLTIQMAQTAKLALEDGTVFTGTSFGAAGEVDGEVCFNTSMTGYQEILTDPSYRGQIVTMTYPQIGNYGVNAEDVESGKPHLAGFVVRELSRRPSNFRSRRIARRLPQAARRRRPRRIDTRALVRRLRTRGAMKGVLSTHRSRRRQPGGQGQGQPGPGRPRPGARGHARRSRASGTSG